MRKETVEILRYIANQKESEDILALYFKTVFLREDMLKSVANLLTLAAVETMEKEQTKEKFGNFVVKVAKNENVKSGIMESFVYKPVKSFLSFGLLGARD